MAWRAASATSCERRALKNGSAATTSAPARCPRRVAKAAPKSFSVEAFTTWSCNPSVRSSEATCFEKVHRDSHHRCKRCRIARENGEERHGVQGHEWVGGGRVRGSDGGIADGGCPYGRRWGPRWRRRFPRRRWRLPRRRRLPRRGWRLSRGSGWLSRRDGGRGGLRRGRVGLLWPGGGGEPPAGGSWGRAPP